MDRNFIKSVSYIAAVAAVMAGLWLTSTYSYLLFHSLAELFSIAVAAAMFTVAWNSYRFSTNGYLTYLGIAFFCVAGLDLIHTLAFKGLGVFPAYGANLPTQLWIAARGMEALSFLIAPVFLVIRVRPWPILLVYLAVTAALLVAIFPLGVFPACYVEGGLHPGLTPFKIAAEYVICLILLTALAGLWTGRKRFSSGVLALIASAIGTTILSELAFTRYLSVYGDFNMVGHLFKVISFLLLYRAAVRATLKDPYQALFRDLKQHEQSLQASEERFRTLGEAAFEGIVITEHGRIVDANDQLLKIMGGTRAEVIGKEVAPFVAPEDRDRVMAGIISAAERHTEHGMFRMDGTPIIVETHGRTIPYHGQQARITAIRDITDSKRKEEELQNLASVVRFSSELISVATLDRKMVFLNDAGVRMLGIEPEEVERTDLMQVVPDHLQEKVRTEVLPALLEHGTWEGELQYRNLKTGMLTDVHAMTFAITDEKTGNPLFLANVSLDITGHKKAEEALRKARNELELRVQERTAELARQAELMNLTHDAIIARDLNNRIFFWNRGAEEMYGWTASEAHGKVKQDFLQTTSPRPRQSIEEELLLHGRWEGELAHTTRDGRKLVVTSRQALRRDENGKATAILEINSDITEQKQLDEERRRLALAVEHTNESVIIMDSRFIIQYVNPAFTRDTGYAWEEAVGRDGGFLGGDVGVSADARQTLEKGAPWSGVYHVNHKNGSVVPASTSITPIKDSSGAVRHLVVVAHDITEQLKLEEQLHQAQKMEAIGTLAGGIAHDFNNILAAILGFTEMAVEDVSDRPDVEKNLQNVLKSTLRARDLVKQILAFSRKADYTRSPIALSPLIDETVKLLRASIPATVDIVLNMTATTDTVLAAPVEVQQLLMNLASNASLAMQEKGGTLEISLSDIDVQPGFTVFDQQAAGQYVQLVVRDTGVGMSPDVMKRVFEPFFTTRGAGEGTGMGLAVVYGIVKGLSGTITVESEPGHGSTFSVFLPKAKTEAKPASIQPTTSPGGHERILFVDDENLLVQLNSERLKSLGYAVTATTSSQEALDLFKAEPQAFDLVVTDQSMPKLAGIDLARMLLTIRNTIPIILCTGHSDTVSSEQAKQAGIKEFLTKPLAKQELAQAVRKVLDVKLKG